MTQLDIYMTDRYNYYVTPQGNRVWAGAMDLMWDELKRNLLQGKDAFFDNISSIIQ
jgi:hypothetical protein